MAVPIDVYVERGKKRAFAGALAWPGWCRSGRDELAALQALLGAAPRYRRAIGAAGGRLRAVGASGDLRVAERLVGDATTDFGAPSIAPTLDASPMDAKELRRQRAILEACWDAFDDAVGAAKGRTLRTGPRGGGRSRTKIVAHVVGAEASYLRRIAGSPPRIPEGGEARAADAERAAVLEALNLAVLEGLPEAGPRGGRLWTPRYFVRRAAWHVLDHAWELEDRTS